MSSEDALNAVNLNTIDSTPLRLQKFKRKQIEDDCTPKSRHIDKRLPQGSIEPKEATKPSSPVKEHVACDRSPVEDGTPRTATAAQTQGRQDVFAIQEERFDGATSVGSILSQPDFSASVSRAAENDSEEDLHSDGEHTPRHEERTSVDGSDGENVVTSARASVRSMSQNSVGDPSDEDTPVRARPQQSAVPSTTSPTRTPRLRDFLMPLNTPRSIVDSALRGRQSTATKESSRGYPMFTEADLISFQTPAPKNHLDPQSRLRHFKTESGEDMLLDMTPRVYSPKSIPIYTLHDLDQIKAEFDQVKREFEARIQTLHEELATSVSNTNHHKALAAQGESLHAEYSKKHVRKVTALKTDWERKTVERLALKDAKIAEKDGLITQLQGVLAQEREEKKEVIAMAEAVLALQQQG